MMITKDVERYDLYQTYLGASMETHQDGNWVKFDDYEQLKEALKKCSPFSRRGLCEFCLKGSWEHADDCEYVRLTGG